MQKCNVGTKVCSLANNLVMEHPYVRMHMFVSILSSL